MSRGKSGRLDRREAPRVDLSLDRAVACIFLEEESTHKLADGRLLDISDDGAKVELEAASAFLEEGMEVVLEFEHPALKVTSRYSCTIRSVKSQGLSILVGLEFEASDRDI